MDGDFETKLNWVKRQIDEGRREHNVQDRMFRNTVEALKSKIEDGGIYSVDSVDDFFYLLLTEPLYLERECSPEAMEYIVGVVTRYNELDNVPGMVSFLTGASNILDPIYPTILELKVMDRCPEDKEKIFQFIGDRALLISGVYPEASGRRARGADPETGRHYYSRLSDRWSPGLFGELSDKFEEYSEGLHVITDKLKHN